MWNLLILCTVFKDNLFSHTFKDLSNIFCPVHYVFIYSCLKYSRLIKALFLHFKHLLFRFINKYLQHARRFGICHKGRNDLWHLCWGLIVSSQDSHRWRIHWYLNSCLTPQLHCKWHICYAGLRSCKGVLSNSCQ